MSPMELGGTPDPEDAVVGICLAIATGLQALLGARAGQLLQHSAERALGATQEWLHRHLPAGKTPPPRTPLGVSLWHRSLQLSPLCAPPPLTLQTGLRQGRGWPWPRVGGSVVSAPPVPAWCCGGSRRTPGTTSPGSSTSSTW